MLSIDTIDWFVIIVYLAALLGMAGWLSLKQKDREDYYVGGRSIGRWPIAISIMATQCSTNSILGAPAFVAFSAGGGLVWLQYELALPLAMIPLMLIFIPIFRQLRLVTVYEYLELRFDRNVRLVLSALFMFVRAFATAVTVYSIAIVIDLIMRIGFLGSVILLGAFTVIYDMLGGIKGVIYSDILQMIILVCVLIIVAGLLLGDANGIMQLFSDFPEERAQTIDLAHHGLGDNHTFAFWPMLIGGFFLYMSYYGCDQSQAQRELSAKNIDEANHALFLNGLLRFPLVALYCFIGLGLAVYAQSDEGFIASLPITNGEPNYNLAVPAYMISQLPAGLVGLSMVALFAAAMSSLDSVLNSLSASTMEDFVKTKIDFSRVSFSEINCSRAITFFWGIITLSGAFFVEDIAPTVLEAINKIGSLVMGPILAVFTVGLLTCFCKSRPVIIGLVLGFLSNLVLWVYFPSISWLWWNVFGFVVTMSSSMLLSTLTHPYVTLSPELIWSRARFKSMSVEENWYLKSSHMVLWFTLLLIFTAFIPMGIAFIS